jgi:hypothetical protein
MMVKITVLNAKHGIYDVGRHILDRDRRQPEGSPAEQMMTIGGFQDNDALRRDFRSGRKMNVAKLPCQESRRTSNQRDAPT